MKQAKNSIRTNHHRSLMLPMGTKWLRTQELALRITMKFSSNSLLTGMDKRMTPRFLLLPSPHCSKHLSKYCKAVLSVRNLLQTTMDFIKIHILIRIIILRIRLRRLQSSDNKVPACYLSKDYEFSITLL